MSQSDPSSLEHLEHAREIIWDALQRLEDAQRVLFRAGDCFVQDVWGDGVRAVIDITERLTGVSGELTLSSSEIDRLARRERKRRAEEAG